MKFRKDRHVKNGQAILVAAVSMLVGGAVLADTIGNSNFEIDKPDANLVVNGGAGSIDWATVAEQRKADTPSGAGDDSMGQGSKEDSEPPSVVAGSIPPNKSDLKNFGVYLEEQGLDKFLHLFWHRVQDPTGSTNMDFEFNQSSTLSSNGVTPVRTKGDLLIQYDLDGGGTNPNLFLSVWLDGSETPPATKNDCEASNKLPCWSKKADLAGVAIGSINTTMIPAASADGLGDISPRTFGEASIDFNAIVAGAGTACVAFGSAYLKSRSAAEFNSAIKDFIAPLTTNVDNCAGLTITKQDEVGALLGGVTFNLYADNAPVGGAYNPTPGEDGNTVLYSCTTATSGPDLGMCTINNILAGDYWVVEVAAPPGHSIASPPYQAVTISGGGSDVTRTFTNNRLPASVTIKKVDDAGNGLNGAVFTLYNDLGVVGTYEAGTDTAVTPAKTCTTSGGGPATPAQCTISSILPPGNYCVAETTVPPGHTAAAPRCFSLVLNQSLTLAENFVNPRQPASVVINKRDDAGALVNGATFTLYNDAGAVGTFEPGTDTAVSPTKSCTTASGTCTISNILPPGNYCVDETTVPAGYDKAAAQCFVLALNQTLTLPNFVDPRQTGAIKITKTRKHAAAAGGTGPHAGVSFAVKLGATPVTGSPVVTNASGEACIDGLLLKQHVGDQAYTVTETVPEGYRADGATSKDVEVTVASSCGDGNEAGVSFGNTPETNITVSVDSQIDGGTASTIECKLGSDVVGSGSTGADGDGSITVNDLAPGIYVCTINVDP